MFNAGVYLENKRKIGKVDEILGKVAAIFFTVKMEPGILSKSFQPNDLLYIGTEKLLPVSKFTNPSSGGGRSSGRGGGRGGRGGGGGGGRGASSFSPSFLLVVVNDFDFDRRNFSCSLLFDNDFDVAGVDIDIDIDVDVDTPGESAVVAATTACRLCLTTVSFIPRTSTLRSSAKHNGLCL